MGPIPANLLIFLLFLIGPVFCEDDWNGPWFPASPDDNEAYNQQEIVENRYAGVESMVEHRFLPMGVKSECDNCDTVYDGGKNATYETVCFNPSPKYRPNPATKALEVIEHFPATYTAPHYCLNETFDYGRPIPTFGPHLPNWAVYGEHTFLPKQRYLHNLEHGAVVMLYHPCADRNEVVALKKIVKGCLYRHIITATKDLTEERPLALVTWGHALYMSKVSKKLAIDFIKKNALNGYEKVSFEGFCDLNLMENAKLVSDQDDNILCPNF